MTLVVGSRIHADFSIHLLPILRKKRTTALCRGASEDNWNRGANVRKFCWLLWNVQGLYALHQDGVASLDCSLCRRRLSSSQVTVPPSPSHKHWHPTACVIMYSRRGESVASRTRGRQGVHLQHLLYARTGNHYEIPVGMSQSMGRYIEW